MKTKEYKVEEIQYTPNLDGLGRMGFTAESVQTLLNLYADDGFDFVGTVSNRRDYQGAPRTELFIFKKPL
jgi:adenine/guanine phosphoribosyltransferase-like PRPP-binding protein